MGARRREGASASGAGLLAQRVEVPNLRQSLTCVDEVCQCAAGGWAEDNAPHAVAALT
ncbi:Hypothetical protein DIP2077 [Corynebacterium diphtheriae]|uniref:Uncharacterized protein n=1 Tax=Corynebacterium diphtheriae (strain ATCC 700971 / NCTC 13129 / Biotype gravis) TaxID=257309 RepID=Q6NF24_CORDI|nr:Hypothetical protein DIP2077 [Corynebacterium diphtheriae]